MASRHVSDIVRLCTGTACEVRLPLRIPPYGGIYNSGINMPAPPLRLSTRMRAVTALTCSQYPVKG